MYCKTIVQIWPEVVNRRASLLTLAIDRGRYPAMSDEITTLKTLLPKTAPRFLKSRQAP